MSISDETNGLNINIVRHGPSTYSQPEWRDPQTANDITTLRRIVGDESFETINKGKQEAVAIIVNTANELAGEIQPQEEVVIWSSPTGRTLETAKIILDTLKAKGIKIRNGSLGREISVFDALGEIKNFSWDLFRPLIEGGSVEFAGHQFVIDKSQSNPNNISVLEYFKNDEMRKISKEVLDSWPQEYVLKVMEFETFFEVTKRVADVISRVKKVSGKHYRLIIVTHDVFASNILINMFNSDTQYINPGEFISMERRGDQLLLTRVSRVHPK
jgi:broad specificity phosphatase PhoE